MGIRRGAGEARLLTKQDRQGGHQGPWHHTHIQMAPEGPVTHPISSYPLTKKVSCSCYHPSSLPSPCRTSIPPSSQGEERKQKVLGLHHCLHHSDNLHIYLVIFSLFFLLLQSISPSLVCAAETCKEEQVVISKMADKEGKKKHSQGKCGV